MKTLYIECKMGAAGDMLMAALYELLTESQRTDFINQMNGLFGPDIQIHAETKKAAGITGTQMHVHIHGQEEHAQEHEHGGHEQGHEHTHEHVHDSHENSHDGHEHDHNGHTHGHAHYTYASVTEQIKALPLPQKVREDALAIYRLIGEAEAKVHDTTIEQIHFHEVGSLDALADVVGCCQILSLLGPEKIVVSPIHVGNGMVHCAHGILPVPAPATAELLKGIPFYTGGVNTELCTPTGAAILRHFATDFGPMPVMSVEQTGVGQGAKELPMLNAVRIFLGETEEKDQAESDRVLDISCNLDDMTGEALGYAMEVLFDAGALDVFYIPVQMKKNRPGVLLHCICAPDEQDKFIRLVLRHTTTRGVRYQLFDRKKLTSHFETADSAYGPVMKKVSEGCGITRSKLEFEDLRRIASEQGLSLQELGEKLS